VSEPPPTRHGHQAFEAISAVQKAIRRSDPEAAAYWSIELALSGHGAWVWRRIRTIVVEDCDLPPGLVADIDVLHSWWRESKGRDLLPVVRAAVSLAIAPKSRLVDWLVHALAAANAERREIPDEALDRHTRRGRAMGRGWEHFLEHGAKLEQFDGDLAALEESAREQAAKVLLAADEPESWLPGQLRIGEEER
jgi:replication-associated recombination protein RarA